MAGHSLFFMLLLPCVFPAEATSLILLAAWVILSQLRTQKGLFSLVAPIFFLLILGLVGANQYPLSDVIKDVWYVGKVIVAIGAGYVLSRYLLDLRTICRIVVLAGAIAAVIHFIEIAIYFKSGATFLSLRSDDGIKGYFITVIGLGLMTSLSRQALGFTRIAYYFSGLVCMASLIASFSRTFIISYILIFFILKGWAHISTKNCIRVIALSALLGLLLVLFLQFSTSGGKSLSQKFIKSGSEVAFQDYSDMSDINEHWRGFESYRAQQDFKKGSLIQKLFGQGLGATVDLGFYMPLGGNDFRYLPVLHNGYMYVLVKFGIIGLFVYLYFLLRMIRLITYVHMPAMAVLHGMRVEQIIAAIGWCFLLSTFVIAGVFNKDTLVSALVLQGLLIGLKNQRKNLRGKP